MPSWFTFIIQWRCSHELAARLFAVTHAKNYFNQVSRVENAWRIRGHEQEGRQSQKAGGGSGAAARGGEMGVFLGIQAGSKKILRADLQS